VGRLFDLPDNIDLYLKLENMQATGKLLVLFSLSRCLIAITWNHWLLESKARSK
jgi:hypothetical protein